MRINSFDEENWWEDIILILTVFVMNIKKKIIILVYVYNFGLHVSVPLYASCDSTMCLNIHSSYQSCIPILILLWFIKATKNTNNLFNNKKDIKGHKDIKKKTWKVNEILLLGEDGKLGTLSDRIKASF
jgi:hypothetical protein